MYVVARNTDSSKMYTNNKPDDFRIQLDLQTITTDYEVGLKEFFIAPIWAKNTFKPGQLYLYSDITDYSVVGNKKKSLLRIVNVPLVRSGGSKENHYLFDRPLYLSVTREHIDSVRFYIEDENGKPVGLKGAVTYVLHFKKKTIDS